MAVLSGLWWALPLCAMNKSCCSDGVLMTSWVDCGNSQAGESRRGRTLTKRSSARCWRRPGFRYLLLARSSPNLDIDLALVGKPSNEPLSFCAVMDAPCCRSTMPMAGSVQRSYQARLVAMRVGGSHRRLCVAPLMTLVVNALAVGSQGYRVSRADVPDEHLGASYQLTIQVGLERTSPPY